MTSLFRVAPFCYMDTHVTEKDNCFVPQKMWTNWIERQEAEVLLAEVEQEGVKHILCVEGPHTMNTNTIYIPSRCLQDFNEDDYARVRVMKEMPPNATKIVLQPLDSEIVGCGIDIAAKVSDMLSHWQTLTKHTMLSVQCEELGGLVVELFVKEIEPADTVLLRGEVPLEVEEPLIKPPSWAEPPQVSPQPQRPPTPIPLEPEELNELVPMTVPMVPATPAAQATPEPSYNIRVGPQAKGFIPFSGTGYRLGS
jgi:hypothetical protein